MKARNVYITGVVLLCLLFSVLLAHASYPPATVLDGEKLAGLYEQAIIEDSPFPAADLIISNISCRPDYVELPPGEVVYRPAMGVMTGRLGHRVVDLTVLVDGQEVQTIVMAGDLELYGQVVSAVRTLKRDTLITREDLAVSRRNISMLGPDLIGDPEELVGQQLTTTLRPGAVLYKYYVKAPQIIKRGDLVEIVVANEQLHISVKGRARSAGALGDVIKVKNMMSRKEVYGRIVNENEVVVDF